MYSADEQYEGKEKQKFFLLLNNFFFVIFSSDSSTSKLINEDNNNHHSRSVKSTRSKIIPSIPVTAMQDDHDYDERKNLFKYSDRLRLIYFLAPCPSFDLHLYAHIDRSSLNQCVFTPVPHQTGKRIASTFFS